MNKTSVATHSWFYKKGLYFCFPCLTVLKHADQSDDDQEVDVFHHFAVVHDSCASCEQDAVAEGHRASLSHPAVRVYSSLQWINPSYLSVTSHSPITSPHRHSFVVSSLCK